MACRIDNFAEEPTNAFGEKLREQVEERLRFYDTGETPKKNIDAMKEVIEQLKAESGGGSSKKKRKADDDAGDAAEKPKLSKEEKAAKKAKKAAKKEKKKKKEDSDSD